MIKYYCDRCGKEVKTLTSVNIPVEKQKGYVDTCYSKHLQLCEKCENEAKEILDTVTEIKNQCFQNISRKAVKIMRDRLIELLRQPFPIIKGYDTIGESRLSYVECEKIADRLLADGMVDKILNWQQTEWGIKEGKISMIQQKADKSWKFRITENHFVSDYTIDEIGKTVFLSREEAEQKLKEGAE